MTNVSASGERQVICKITGSGPEMVAHPDLINELSSEGSFIQSDVRRRSSGIDGIDIVQRV